MKTTKILENPETKSFSYSFEVALKPQDVFDYLLNVKNWWIGLYEETIEGSSEKIEDEFTFLAGGGVHYSKAKLVESIPNRKIVWQIVESNLSFVPITDEWTGTQIGFELKETKNGTTITFTHEGLVPKFQCYGNCSNAWTQYLVNLNKTLNHF